MCVCVCVCVFAATNKERMKDLYSDAHLIFSKHSPEAYKCVWKCECVWKYLCVWVYVYVCVGASVCM